MFTATPERLTELWGTEQLETVLSGSVEIAWGKIAYSRRRTTQQQKVDTLNVINDIAGFSINMCVHDVTELFQVFPALEGNVATNGADDTETRSEIMHHLCLLLLGCEWRNTGEINTLLRRAANKVWPKENRVVRQGQSE